MELERLQILERLVGWMEQTSKRRGRTSRRPIDFASTNLSSMTNYCKRRANTNRKIARFEFLDSVYPPSLNSTIGVPVTRALVVKTFSPKPMALRCDIRYTCPGRISCCHGRAAGETQMSRFESSPVSGRI